MKSDPYILLLAGSFEARRLAEAMSRQGLRYDIWLSEAPRGPAPLPQMPRLRRFEDAAAMRMEIAQEGFTAILDASHVFDRQVTEQGSEAAACLGLPYLRIERAPWDVSADPRWRVAHDVGAANVMIPQGARVFCATGWDSLAEYADFRGEVLMLRQTRKHARPAPFPFVQLVFGDPPFDAADEQALFEKLGVDLLICRNLGGRASLPKLEAARALDLDVILIDRPAAPVGLNSVAQIEDALAWVTRL